MKSSNFLINPMIFFISNFFIKKKIMFVNIIMDVKEAPAYSTIDLALNRANAVDAINKNTIDIKIMTVVGFNKEFRFNSDDG